MKLYSPNLSRISTKLTLKTILYMQSLTLIKILQVSWQNLTTKVKDSELSQREIIMK